jgi:AcrR family transcriptional regulator
MPKRRWLTKNIVLEKAADLANQRGDARQLSLADLAVAFDIRSPSLYNHVAGLEGLLHDLTLGGLQQLLAQIRQAVAGKVGREALLATAQAYRNFAHTQPGIYPLTLRAHDPQDAEWTTLSNELVGTLQLILASYGLSGEPALHAIRGFRSLLHGFVSLETAGGFGLPLERDESFNLLLEIYLDGLAGWRG